MIEKARLKHRILSVMLAVVMVFGMLPVSPMTALAADYVSVSVSSGNIVISKESDSLLRVTYDDYDEGYMLIPNSQDLTIVGRAFKTYTVIVEDGVNANIVLRSVEITSDSTSPFHIKGTASVNLTLTGDNWLGSYNGDDDAYAAGIRVESGASLTIDGTGTLSAQGGYRAAGIGGGQYGSGGTVTINGGTVIATGGEDGAGIGGGLDGSGGTVTVNGGTVTATGGAKGAGIGGGSGGTGGIVTVNGGTVIATGGSSSAGMGGGYLDGGGAVTINGGTITAIGGDRGAGIGGGQLADGCTVVITGGTIKAIAGDDCPCAIGAGFTGGSAGTLTDGRGNTVSLFDITLDDAAANTEVSEVTGITYGVNGVETLDTNKLYFYLPSQKPPTSITAGGVEYICNKSLTYYTKHEFICEAAQNCCLCGYQGGEHNYIDGVCTACGIGENGVYYISTEKQLMDFADFVNEGNTNANAVLLADIDLEGYDWSTICETGLYFGGYGTDFGYCGTFDGNGHVIKNVTVSSSATMDASCGLFGTVSGTIQNLGIEGFTFVDGGKDIRAGAIAGQLITENGKVSNCYVKGATITPGDHVIGGIAGCVYDGTVENCYVVESTFTGASGRFGHIVGDSRGDNGDTDRKGTVSNCYGDNETLYSSRSGIVNGVVKKNADMFASGEVAYLLNGSSSDGVWKQTIGTQNYPQFTGDTVYITYADCSDDGLTYTNDADKAVERPAHNYDADGICTVCGAYEPATLNNNGIYEIGNVGQLMWFAELVNQSAEMNHNAVLINDIDMNGVVWNAIAGTSSAGYAGTFDGRGYTIENLNQNAGLENGQKESLFASIGEGGVVKNLIVDNADVWTSNHYNLDASGVVAMVNSGTISGCIVKNSNVQQGAYEHLGGIAGLNTESGIIENCAVIDSTLQRRWGGASTGTMGGIVQTNNGLVKNCYTYECTFSNGTTENGAIIAKGTAPTNCYYYTASTVSETYGTAKDVSSFTSGEVTYLLNGDQSNIVWKQTIGEDTYPNFTGLTVLYDETANPQYYNESLEIISVSISWGAMEFTYTDGEWQPESHTYSDGAWTPDEEDGNVITVQNNGDVAVNVTFAYEKTVSEVEGSFTDESGNAVASSVALAVDEEKKFKLLLSGKPNSALDNATLGSITVTISLPSEEEGS